MPGNRLFTTCWATIRNYWAKFHILAEESAAAQTKARHPARPRPGFPFRHADWTLFPCGQSPTITG